MNEQILNQILNNLKEFSEQINRNIDESISALERKLDKKIDESIEALDKKIDERFETLDKKIDERFETLDKKIDENVNRLDKKIDEIVNRMDEFERIRQQDRIQIDEIANNLENIFRNLLKESEAKTDKDYRKTKIMQEYFQSQTIKLDERVTKLEEVVFLK